MQPTSSHFSPAEGLHDTLDVIRSCITQVENKAKDKQCGLAWGQLRYEVGMSYTITNGATLVQPHQIVPYLVYWL
jgi:hypothetical protein